MKQKSRRRHVSETWFIIASLIIPIFIFIVFYIVPNFNAFFMAFQGRTGNWTFDNFKRVWDVITSKESDLQIAVRNTLLAFAVNVVAYPFKVLVPYFIYKKVPFYGFYRVVFFLPTIIFGVATSLIFMQMISPSGEIAKLVGELAGLDYAPDLLADSRFANWVIFLEMLWMGFPGDLIIWGGTFARIPNDLMEAGRLDGTNWWTEFTKIVVPMVWPTVGLQMVLLTCNLFSSGGNVFLLTGGEYGTMTIGAWLQIQLLQGSGISYTSNVYNYMSAVGLCITVIAIVLATLVRKNANKAFTEVEF